MALLEILDPSSDRCLDKNHDRLHKISESGIHKHQLKYDYGEDLLSGLAVLDSFISIEYDYVEAYQQTLKD